MSYNETFAELHKAIQELKLVILKELEPILLPIIRCLLRVIEWRRP